MTEVQRSMRSLGTTSQASRQGAPPRVPLLPHVHTSDLQLADVARAVYVPEDATPQSGRSPLGSRRGARPAPPHRGSRITSRMSGKSARAPSERSVIAAPSAQDRPLVPAALPSGTKLPKIAAAGTGRDVAGSWTFFTDVNVTARHMRRRLKDTGVDYIDRAAPPRHLGAGAEKAASAPEPRRGVALTAREFVTDKSLRHARPVASIPAEGFLPAILSPATRTTVTTFFRAQSQAVAPGGGARVPDAIFTPQSTIGHARLGAPAAGDGSMGGTMSTSTPAEGAQLKSFPTAQSRPGGRSPQSLETTPQHSPSSKLVTRAAARSPVRGYAALRHNPPTTAREALHPVGKGKPLPPLSDYLQTFNRSRLGTAGSLAEATLAFDGDLRPCVTPPPTVDLSKSHAEQLQSVAGTCIAVLVGMAPLAGDERGYAEESLDVRVRLRDQYRGLHPVQHVALASNLPTELREAVASVTTRVPNPAGCGTVLTKTVVSVDWARDPAVQHNVALMKPRGLDYRVVRGAVAQLSDPAVPVERGARLTYLRARQKDAEVYFGVQADTSTNAERMSRRGGETTA